MVGIFFKFAENYKNPLLNFFQFMKNYLFTFILIFFIFSCKTPKEEKVTQATEINLCQYVNPFIGTKNMGHTFPGATVPFGMVQLSPETNRQTMFIDGAYNTDTYKYCAGYQYSDSTIFGFSHTHFSGTGHSDLGDFSVMPTVGELQLESGSATVPNSGYYSYFSHKNEFAEPAYYKVLLKNYNITAELTASERVGFHKYTFPKSDSSHIILDLMANIYDHEDKNVWTFVRVENDSLITGYRQINGWARTRIVYFAMQFSKPFKNYGSQKYDDVVYKGFYRKFNETENFPEFAGKNLKAYFDFETEEKEEILIKFALSAVSSEGALQNMQAEIPDWNFEEIRQQGKQKWNKELSKVVVETLSEEDKITFYTAMYHCFLSPVVYEDVSGMYRGLDQNIHQSESFTNYTIFSLWDTYRALHPLFNILQPKRNGDMINSMLAHQEESVHKMLPIWSHYSNENWCMIGYHSVSVIADAVAKGNIKFDTQRALQACISTSKVPYFDGLGEYLKKGYVPEDKSSSSVSKTIEYAYDDWAIAQIAKAIGNEAVYNEYMKRSLNFENVFHTGSRFMRPKLDDGSWKTEFDALDTHGQGFIEGNSWTYSFFVPHNIEKLIELMGGENKFVERLDSLFTMQLDDKYIEKNEDITRDGIIGNYVHGNEPGHHIPYLYNYTSSAWKTQERVRMIQKTMYGSTVDGLCGNDDAGQMSAWYIFSALGFYPVCPGSNQYELGSPSVSKATIHLENGKTLIINTINQSPENVYVEKVTVNGTEINRNYLLHSEIINGGEIVFYLSDSFK